MKIGLVPFCTILFALSTHKNPFWHLENGKSFFCKRKLKTPFGTIVWNVKVHLCAKYGHITINYGMDMALNVFFVFLVKKINNT